MTTATQAALTYYGAHKCALFPIPAGSKNPTGIVASFAHDHSASPEQWAAWSRDHNCNFGVVAGPSRLIIVDTDIKKIGRDAAWAERCRLFIEWGIDPAKHQPHVQSASGGWHDYFAVPVDTDATQLRQPPAAGCVDIRAGNGFAVAAGSHHDGRPYLLLSDAPPHPAPEALLRHCARRATTTPAANVGTRDATDVASLFTWLAERDEFADYTAWVGAGMAAKLEFGDDGLELWRLTHNETVTPDIEHSKWQSFAAEPSPGCMTINSIMSRAHAAGWRGQVRKSSAAMFNEVAQLAAAAGASLPPGSQAMPMVAGQQALTDIAAPILDEFLTSTRDLPSRPADPDSPTLPDAASGHGLYRPLKEAVARILAAAESPKSFKGSRYTDALALLSLVHQDTFDCVCRRIRTLGCTLPDSRIKTTAAAYADRVERAFVKQDDWIYDAKGQIENTNSDNVAVLLNILNISIRYNAWLERMEIQGGIDDLRFPDWTYVDDLIIARLRTRANRTKTRFTPAKEFFWESLISLAVANSVDPVLDRLTELERAWDRKPRLSTWLSHACHTECDPYHQAVSRNILGGLVRRAREPGAKHDTMAVFHGPQGPGKSTMAAVIADLGVTPLATILSRSSPWFTDTVLLGAESKELVLALAGKTVAEIGEMGMRGSVNANVVKAMVSRQVDEGRTAYARAVTSRPRRNIFIGTVNGDEPLTDPTGNRRFLPVAVHSAIDLEWLSANIGQIVGEAAALHTAGVSFDLPASVWGIAAEHQEAARGESDIEIKFAEWFSGEGLAFVTASDLVDACSWSNLRTNTHGVYMKRLGFRPMTAYVEGKKKRVWYRGTDLGTTKGAVRYMVGRDANGRTRVEIRVAG